ncbi:MAG: polymer-forming cytoskeletal protein [Gammaproteobacteria bacterium]|nr:polymer-forming cytoskeletal protein [Gammaproteobacteria bacterium]
MFNNNEKKRRLTDNIHKSQSILSESSILTGTLAGDSDYVIYGSIDGTCDLAGTLMLQKPGKWTGNITAGNVVIAGKVDGDVQARDKLELTATARIAGNITGQTIAIAEGAVVEGNVSMTGKGGVSYFEDRRTGPANVGE